MFGGRPTFHSREGSKEEKNPRIEAAPGVSRRIRGPRGMLDGLRDFCHVLSADGQVLYVSTATTIVTGHASNDIVGRHINDFLHPDDTNVFKSEYYDAILYDRTARFIYRFSRPDGSWTILESILYPFTPGSIAHAAPTQNATTGRQILVVARPYSCKNNALLDSFLEHKIEHERLLHQLQALRNEATEDPEDFELGTATIQQQYEARPTIEQSYTVPESSDMLGNTSGHPRELEDIGPGTRQGLSSLGDLGIPVSENRDLNALSKRNSNKRAKKEPHVCMFCGTVNSPEWRKGPGGPKTLCNACGLRWAKSILKRAPTSSVVGSDEDTIKKEED